MQTLFASLLAVVTMAINAQSWKTTLPDMLFGMIGIFIVIGVIILVTYGLGAKTLFATHYHELTVLEGQISGVKNYNIAAKKKKDDKDKK